MKTAFNWISTSKTYFPLILGNKDKKKNSFFTKTVSLKFIFLTFDSLKLSAGYNFTFSHILDRIENLAGKFSSKETLKLIYVHPFTLKPNERNPRGVILISLIKIHQYEILSKLQV